MGTRATTIRADSTKSGFETTNQVLNPDLASPG